MLKSGLIWAVYDEEFLGRDIQRGCFRIFPCNQGHHHYSINGREHQGHVENNSIILISIATLAHKMYNDMRGQITTQRT